MKEPRNTEHKEVKTTGISVSEATDRWDDPPVVLEAPARSAPIVETALEGMVNLPQEQAKSSSSNPQEILKNSVASFTQLTQYMLSAQKVLDSFNDLLVQIPDMDTEQTQEFYKACDRWVEHLIKTEGDEGIIQADGIYYQILQCQSSSPSELACFYHTRGIH